MTDDAVPEQTTPDEAVPDEPDDLAVGESAAADELAFDVDDLPGGALAAL